MASCSFSIATQIKPFFEKQLMLPKHNPGSEIADGLTHLTTPMLPVYISGVLAVFDKASCKFSYSIQLVLFLGTPLSFLYDKQQKLGME